MLAPSDASTADPQTFVEEQAAPWIALWWREHPAHTDTDLEGPARLAAFRAPFEDIAPRHGTHSGTPHIDGAALRDAARRARGKAAGPDGWTAEKVLRLPSAWWETTARVWTLAFRVGRIPRRWSDIMHVLIPKPKGGARPLGIANLLWRIGMSTTIRSLSSWVDCWAGVELQGSLPGRSAATALARIQHDTWASFANPHDDDYGFGITGGDLSKAFDSIVPELAISFAERLGLHSGVCGVLLDFYRTATRTCKTAHAVLPWLRAPIGLIQGCPASPMLMATVMGSWWQTVSVPGVQASLYVDDRAYRTAGSNDDVVRRDLQLVATRPRAFDARVGLVNNTDKTQTAASSQSLRTAFD